MAVLHIFRTKRLSHGSCPQRTMNTWLPTLPIPSSVLSHCFLPVAQHLAPSAAAPIRAPASAGGSSLFFFCLHFYFFHLLFLRPVSSDIEKIRLYNAVDISCLFCSSLPFFCTIIPYLWGTCPPLYVSDGAVDHSSPVPPYLNPIHLATCMCMKTLSSPLGCDEWPQSEYTVLSGGHLE